MSIVRFLAEEAKVPDTPDLSGTTTLMWAVYKTLLRVELDDILLQAGGNINFRSRYGCVAAHDAAMVRDYTPAGKRKTCDALRCIVAIWTLLVEMALPTPRKIAKNIPRDTRHSHYP